MAATGGSQSWETKLAELTKALAARDARIAELEKLLEESRRSGKRHSAPFSKGDPKGAPAHPGARRARPTTTAAPDWKCQLEVVPP